MASNIAIPEGFEIEEQQMAIPDGFEIETVEQAQPTSQTKPVQRTVTSVEQTQEQPKTPVLTGGVEKKYIQNWDKKGRIYYTDEQGNRVDFNTPLSQKIGNKIKATAFNVKNWINETNPESEAYKQKANVALTLATLPMGLGRAGTQFVASKLTPMLGRKVGLATAQGVGSGLVGGGVYGAGEALIEGENPVTGALQGGTIGALTGGALGGGVAKIGRNIKAKNLRKQRAGRQQVEAVEPVEEVTKNNVVEYPLQVVDDNIPVQKSDVIEQVPTETKIVDEVVEEVPTLQPTPQIEPTPIAETPIPQQTGRMKERGFVDTVRQNYGEDVANQIQDKNYEVYAHEMQKQNWNNRTPEEKLQALNEVDNINPDVMYGKAEALNQAIKNGEELPFSMLNGIARNLTNAGQEIEAAKHFVPTTPEGIALNVVKEQRKSTPKHVTKLKDEAETIINDVNKINEETQAKFNEWLAKQDLPKEAKVYSESGDQLALLKAMERHRKSNVAKLQKQQNEYISAKKNIEARKQLALEKEELAAIKELQKEAQHKQKVIENLLKKRISKEREVRTLAKDIATLQENGGLNADNLIRLIDKQYGIPNLSNKDYAKMVELSDKFAQATTEREKAIAEGLIKKFVFDKQPKTWAQKDRTIRSIDMLLSLPSRGIDLISTAGFQGIRAVDEAVAKGISKISRSGTRGGFETLNPKLWLQNAKRGAKEGAEDIRLGINTARTGETDRYEIGFLPQFEDTPILNQLEKGLSYSVRIPDRAFYEAQYASALNDLMKTGTFTAEEAAEIAHKEALQAVFQGEGLLSNFSKGTRDLLNGKIGNRYLIDDDRFKNFADTVQLGNRVMPFVQTPATLIAEGIERSPIGLAKGIVQRATAKTPEQVRAAELTLAKGLGGTAIGTVGGGIALNRLENNIGSLNEADKYGNDVTGMPAQSVVIGDKAISLANAPYITIPAGLGKALLEPNKSWDERAINSLVYTGNILADLPMLKGLGDLYKGGINLSKAGGEYASARTQKDKDEAKDKVLQELGRATGQQAANMISQYILGGGTLGTIRNAVDPYNRELTTYNENPLLGTAEYVGNRLANRLPFVSNTLPMRYNVLGEPSMRNNIQNPVARFAEATISPIRIRNYRPEPYEMQEMQRVQDYAMENDIRGKTKLKFAKPSRTLKIDGEKIKLNNEQYSELTRLYNGKVYDELQFLMNTSEYQSADEETKIEWIREVMKEKKEEAENEIFDIIE